MTSEREAKLTASPEVRLANLDGLIAGATAIALAGRDLDATYYDTAGLDLARSGITLRHRSGEAGPSWTLKLPGDRAGQVVTRNELTFEGSPTDVPAAARDLVSAHVRSHPLVQIARLETRRSPMEVRDATGERLAEVVDDLVIVLEGSPQPQEFREIEIEVLAKGRVGDQLLVAAVDRLVGVGCRTDTPLPKLIRALGARAFEPPELVVPPLGRKAPLQQLVRHTFAHSVLHLLQHDPGVRLGENNEELHQFRVGIRRLRSDLRTFRPLLEPTPIRTLRDGLRWLGSAVGAVRDNDVLAERLRAETETLPKEDVSEIRVLQSLLASQSDSARSAMLSALRNPRYFALLDSLVNAANEPPIRAERAEQANRPASRVSGKFIHQPWRRITEAVATLGDDPPDLALHQIRILAKRCRYATEAVAPVIDQATRLAAALADLQTVLGELHDTVITEAWLRQAAVSEPDCALVAGELILLQTIDRARLRSEWLANWKRASAKKLCSWI
jgi:CHAD domain-containing protein